MGLELLFLLLPLAALSGWWMGRRKEDEPDEGYRRFTPEYFKGLNYILNEQPDKAIEIFVDMIDVDGETIETHFALGSLFRRRGEVDRAIHIHQNLIARPTLNRTQRNAALFELARDYMAAGLLDRAENLFSELGSTPEYGAQATQHLLDIFQQEKEWENAIDAARRLSARRGDDSGRIIAHFYCELAEQALDRGEISAAGSLIRKALAEDRNCVRASLLEGQMAQAQGDHKTAVRALKRVEAQDPDYLLEALTPLKASYDALGKTTELVHFLRRVAREGGGLWSRMALADLLDEHNLPEAEALIAAHLTHHPSLRGVQYLAELKARRSRGNAQQDLQVISRLVERLIAAMPAYGCTSCGFTAQSLHWQCPSCKNWSTLRPLQGPEEAVA